ncbi:hypothetical protein K435DRAFT_683992 [Dendrothele bispora CBS 962.96]|uniref:Uncharacterized protein n=1 Tax=Dendrothele bispora (strain CBS 962.96) TaxID=1314807 RepID=A0A4S8LD45_DENBC|nr:hypothetical protein K435DRAFT_683992 [Dendrothele bispora CBS 962.96]
MILINLFIIISLSVCLPACSVQNFGHKVYLSNLKRQQGELGDLKRVVQVAGHKCILKSMRGTWLLGEDYGFRHVDTQCGICTDAAPSLREKESPSDSDAYDSIDLDPVQREVKAKRSRAHLDLWTKLAFLCPPPESRFFDERLVVLITYLIRMICGDAELFMHAVTNGIDELEEMLSDSDLNKGLSDKLFEFLDQPNPKQLRLAIEDVLRQKEDRMGEEHVSFLGRRLYKGFRKGLYPIHAWGHWLAFFSSECCCSITSSYTSVSFPFYSLRNCQPHASESEN